ncbi:hypothetical protein EJ04DRAFT_508844 [Polyplosphaeria fusca]|uniref:Uncharacterized protein n=1 Tax=Polyplosphaeria fusca TaxID=682080 RepID=A0A9P4R7L5_9PLEO|nr:hypothetical protein EJ04DRAFT_508844 [Polyplosphaeria fusca]
MEAFSTGTISTVQTPFRVGPRDSVFTYTPTPTPNFDPNPDSLVSASTNVRDPEHPLYTEMPWAWMTTLLTKSHFPHHHSTPSMLSTLTLTTFPPKPTPFQTAHADAPSSAATSPAHRTDSIPSGAIIGITLAITAVVTAIAIFILLCARKYMYRGHVKECDDKRDIRDSELDMWGSDFGKRRRVEPDPGIERLWNEPRDIPAHFESTGEPYMSGERNYEVKGRSLWERVGEANHGGSLSTAPERNGRDRERLSTNIARSRSRSVSSAGSLALPIMNVQVEPKSFLIDRGM